MRVYVKKGHIKVALVIIVAVLLVLGAMKLISIWDSKQGAISVEDIQTTEQSNKEKDPMPSVSVRDPTSEEIERLTDGSLTKDELIQDLVDDAVVHPPDEETGEVPGDNPGYKTEDNDELPTPDDNKENTEPGDQPDQSTPGDQPGQSIQTEYERRLAEIIAEVYVLRDEYIATLEAMYSEAEAQLGGLAAKEDNEDAIIAMANTYITKATELELQCDGQIDALMDELEELLKAYGQDLGLVDEIKYTYAQEKSLKKAWYMSELERRGLN